MTGPRGHVRPLGGISCGALELRGDGSLHEWTIMNQSPGGSGKVQSYGDAYFAVRVGGKDPPVSPLPPPHFGLIAPASQRGDPPRSELEQGNEAGPADKLLLRGQTPYINRREQRETKSKSESAGW